MAKTLPKVYYGLHMVEGVAEYREDPAAEPYRILILENALKNMDPTFAGLPVYVQHVDEVDLKNLQNEADGYVLKSFYNPADGKHWAEFIVVSDEGHEAIRRGWKLSNSYIPKATTIGGEWHAVAYQNEITSGEYEHLAIVPNPRYTESVIMTPEEFKRYNEDKKIEIERLTNAKGKENNEMPKLSFFKKQKVENAIDPEMSVLLPKSGKEVTIEKLVNDADKMMQDGNAGLADMAHKVKLHDGSYCNVGELVEKHKALNDEMNAMKASMQDSKEEESEDVEEKVEVDVEGDNKSKDNDEEEEMVEEEEDEKEIKNEEEDDEDSAMKPGEEDKEVEAAKKKKNAAEKALKEADDILKARAKKKNIKSITNEDELKRKREAKEKADRLRNAHERVSAEPEATVEIMADQVERGRSRYGS